MQKLGTWVEYEHFSNEFGETTYQMISVQTNNFIMKSPYFDLVLVDHQP